MSRPHTNSVAIELQLEDIYCILGVKPNERTRPRPVNVTVRLVVDADTTRDRLDGTVDYSLLAAAIRRTTRQGAFYLIESLAYAIADECLAFHRVASVDVRVLKPEPSASIASAAVELHRAKA